MTIEEALAVLERGTIEPLYVICGPNRYWGQIWLKRAREKFLGSAKDTGMVRLDATADIKAVLLELAADGFFSSKKMVIVDSPRWNKKDEIIGDYLRHPVTDSLLVLIEDKLSTAVEKVVGNHRIIDLKPLSVVSFRRFVEEEATQRKIQFAQGGLDELLLRVKGNEYQTIQELEKMVLVGLDRWSKADVADQVLPLPEDRPIWDVTDALLRRDVKLTISLISQHLGAGVAPLMLFITMSRQIILLDHAKSAQAQGLSISTFQRQQGLKDFVAKKVWGAARAFESEALSLMLEWAYRIDVFMKTGYGEPEVWLLMWVALMAPPSISRRR